MFKNWKTTLCGGLGLVFTGAAAMLPQPYNTIAVGAATLCNAVGHLFAKDS